MSHCGHRAGAFDILFHVMLFYFIYLKHCIILNSVNSRWHSVARFMCFSLCCLGPIPSSCHFFVYNIKFGFPDDKFFRAHVLFFFFQRKSLLSIHTTPTPACDTGASVMQKH